MVLGRWASTVSGELPRNTVDALVYASQTAQVCSSIGRQAGRRASKLDPRGPNWGVILAMLDWKWSPQQIAGTLKCVFPNEPKKHVSRETIYVERRGELRRQLIVCLRQGRGTRMPHTRGTDRRGQRPDMVSIHVRPPEVNDRVVRRHLEGDFIRGADNKSSLGVLVERSSRLVLLAKMEDATAASALAGFAAKLSSMAAPLRQTLTYDQGKELTRHKDLTQSTGVAVCFCDPHSPWQRGTCENTDGLLRQYRAQWHGSGRVRPGRSERHR